MASPQERQRRHQPETPEHPPSAPPSVPPPVFENLPRQDCDPPADPAYGIFRHFASENVFGGESTKAGGASSGDEMQVVVE